MVPSDIEALGDLDGDGVPDLAVGTIESTGNRFAGAVHVLSGNTGMPLYSPLTGQGIDNRFGKHLSSADFDGDGLTDLLVTSSDKTQAFRGYDGALLFESPGGASSIAAVDDINNDGVPDFVVGGSRVDSGQIRFPGAFFARSGADGTLLFGPVLGDQREGYFGESVVYLGDVNGDGIGEILVSAPQQVPGGSTTKDGQVYIYDLMTQLPAVPTPVSVGSRTQDFGHCIARCGDLTGDGIDDFAVGAPNTTGPMGKGGAFYVFSGAAGNSLLFSHIEERDLWRLGNSIACGDIDSDGANEIIVGGVGYEQSGAYRNMGSISVFSGSDFRLLAEVVGESEEEYLGWSIAVVGDLEDDGFSEIAFSRGSSAQFVGSGDLITLGVDPFLTLSEDSLSVAQGGVVHLDLDFPIEGTGFRYQVLASALGTGPISKDGILIPLSPDQLLLLTAAGNYPSYVTNMAGPLSVSGQAAALLAPAPGEFPASLVGQDLFVASVATDAVGSVLYSSAARALEVRL